jgi:hypothetical protein
VNKALVLRSLSIRLRDYYSRNVTDNGALSYEGKLEFTGSSGEVAINLNAELSQRVLAVVADAMTATTRELANNLTADVLSGVPALAAPIDADALNS